MIRLTRMTLRLRLSLRMTRAMVDLTADEQAQLLAVQYPYLESQDIERALAPLSIQGLHLQRNQVREFLAEHVQPVLAGAGEEPPHGLIAVSVVDFSQVFGWAESLSDDDPQTKAKLDEIRHILDSRRWIRRLRRRLSRN